MKAQKQNKNAFTHKEEHTMDKTLIAFFSRADENYFGGAMRYVKVGNTEIVAGIMKDLNDADGGLHLPGSV